jgi:uncharacterized protein YjiS (DUF1127 family)
MMNVGSVDTSRSITHSPLTRERNAETGNDEQFPRERVAHADSSSPPSAPTHAPETDPIAPVSKGTGRQRSIRARTTPLSYWRNELEVRRATRALAEFDDRTLRNLGIPNRSQIEFMVRFCREC